MKNLTSQDTLNTWALQNSPSTKCVTQTDQGKNGAPVPNRRWKKRSCHTRPHKEAFSSEELIAWQSLPQASDKILQKYVRALARSCGKSLIPTKTSPPRGFFLIPPRRWNYNNYNWWITEYCYTTTTHLLSRKRIASLMSGCYTARMLYVPAISTARRQMRKCISPQKVGRVKSGDTPEIGRMPTRPCPRLL